MGRFAVITMTDAAAVRVNEIMATRENARGVRLGIKKGGCAGMEYTVDLVTEPNPKDDHIERDGAHVYVAPEAALFLFGTEMDFEQTTLRTGFTFRNPEPEFGLRLRRIGRAEARRPQGARRGARRRSLALLRPLRARGGLAAFRQPAGKLLPPVRHPRSSTRGSMPKHFGRAPAVQLQPYLAPENAILAGAGEDVNPREGIRRNVKTIIPSFDAICLASGSAGTFLGTCAAFFLQRFVRLHLSPPLIPPLFLASLLQRERRSRRWSGGEETALPSCG